MKRSWALLCLLCVGACGEDEAPPAVTPATADYELFSFARVIDVQSDSPKSVSPTVTGYKLTFAGSPAALQDVSGPDILKGTMNIIVVPINGDKFAGMVLGVTSIERKSDTVVTGVSLPPQLAFSRLIASATKTVQLENVPNTALSAEGISGQYGNVGVTLRMGGQVDFDMQLAWQWPADIDEAALAKQFAACVSTTSCASLTEAMPKIDATLAFDADASGVFEISATTSTVSEKTIDMGTISLGTVIAGPLVFRPRLDVAAHLSLIAQGSVKLRAETGFTSNHQVVFKDAALVSEGGVSHTLVYTTTVGPGSSASAEAELLATFHLPLYGIIGPYVSVGPVASLAVSPDSTPCWMVSGGLRTSGGMEINLPYLGALGPDPITKDYYLDAPVTGSCAP